MQPWQVLRVVDMEGGRKRLRVFKLRRVDMYLARIMICLKCHRRAACITKRACYTGRRRVPLRRPDPAKTAEVYSYERHNGRAALTAAIIAMTEAGPSCRTIRSPAKRPAQAMSLHVLSFPACTSGTAWANLPDTRGRGKSVKPKQLLFLAIIAFIILFGLQKAGMLGGPAG